MKEKTKKYRKSKLPLYFLPINPHQFIIHTYKRDVINTIVAIGDTSKSIVVINPAYLNMEHRIAEKAIQFNLDNVRDFTIKVGDGFAIDTWDNKIARFSQS